MENIYLVKWPNGSISILNAHSALDLYDKLDCECDPYDAEIYKIKTDNGFFHITTEAKNYEIQVDLCRDILSNKLFKYKMPDNMFEKWIGAIMKRSKAAAA